MHGPVASARDARAIAGSERFDLVVLDIRLIDGTSTSFAEELRENGVRVLFVTGYSDRGALPGPLAGVPRLVKPVERDVLRAALIAALET